MDLLVQWLDQGNETEADEVDELRRSRFKHFCTCEEACGAECPCRADGVGCHIEGMRCCRCPGARGGVCDCSSDPECRYGYVYDEVAITTHRFQVIRDYRQALQS